MRFLKIVLVLFGCALAFVNAARAGDVLGTHDSGRVTFPAPVRVGSALLPAGDYMVRRTTEGSDHVMVFEPVSGKGPHAKAKCQLVELGNKADQTRTVFDLNSANERVLQELVFRGDTAKHVF